MSDPAMKIVLFGNGRMSDAIRKLAELSKRHCIIATISRTDQSIAPLADADAAIDFSHPAAVITNLQSCIAANTPLVIGTTGWEERLSDAKKLINQHPNFACLFSPNFSIGVYLYKQIIAHAAMLMQPFDEYDACGIEYHHRHKIDSPSGTAKALTQTIQNAMPRLPSFHFTSVRCGELPGIHSILFDSPFDTITLTHEARSRQGFAQGALLAAEWLAEKRGFFSFEEMMLSIQEKAKGAR
jgi:4-hydroxy-tetrahydrodipicolinate reductase